MRRIGVLTPFPADDAEGHARLTAFTQALQQSGWTVGQNVRIDYRWGPGNPATMRKHATELVALEPDVVLALPPPPSGHCWRQAAPSQSCS
jgi:putative ABC transport system substrate-binding protein